LAALQSCLVRTLSPKPDLAVFLQVSAHTASTRKADYELSENERRARLYDEEATKLGVMRLDGERPRAEVCRAGHTSVVGAEARLSASASAACRSGEGERFELSVRQSAASCASGPPAAGRALRDPFSDKASQRSEHLLGARHALRWRASQPRTLAMPRSKASLPTPMSVISALQPALADTAALYSPAMVDQVRATLDHLQAEGVASSFVVAGLCAGALWAFNVPSPASPEARPRRAGSGAAHRAPATPVSRQPRHPGSFAVGRY